jgi:predicted ATPase
MEEIVQALFDEGALAHNGVVRLTKPLTDIKVPPTVQGVLTARIDRLPAAEKELLQTLAVLGKDFPLSLVKSVVRMSDDEVERMLSDLQLGEFIYEQPALPDVEYTFKHALTQEVAYNSVLVEWRRILHSRTGAAIEELYAGRLDEHLDELARHYRIGGNIEKATEYLYRAGQQTARRAAYSYAIGQLESALGLLASLPATPEREHRELDLWLDIGQLMIATQGYAAAEVEHAHARARELAVRVGSQSELFTALSGLWAFSIVRAHKEAARALGEEMFEIAQRSNDRALLMRSHFALGDNLLWFPDLLSARSHLEQAIRLYGLEGKASTKLVATELGVFNQTFLGQVLWYMGYPDQAWKACHEAVLLGSRLLDPASLCEALSFAAWIRQYRREPRLCRELAERNIALCTEYGLAFFLAQSIILRGWALAQGGEVGEAVVQIRQGIKAYRATGAELEVPYWLKLLAEACLRAGRIGEGLAAIEDAVARASDTDLRFCEAELLRLKGELLLVQNSAQAHEAQDCFRRALDIARHQSGKSLELRTAVGLAGLLAKQGRRDEARAMLAEIYGWFTEGFDTRDLKDAKALLDELGT